MAVEKDEPDDSEEEVEEPVSEFHARARDVMEEDREVLDALDG